MSDIAIRAEGLGKKYVIGHETERECYTALRDVLARQARGLARSARDLMAGRALIAGDEREEFWALKDVSFEIKRGEVVGIIGRNGAGKSTLLKVLSRITEPTEGRVTIDGRVASLLEVGTGFHPELTGRENIYLNGAILGMTRAEIRRKFDEIVDFAGVEKFLDTPVKRYSSGMYVRLAFAVAAHLEPEILVVDEVLAVGDAEFQKKCLGKMTEVAKGGRTVLFVSHNTGAIRTLCARVLLLEFGHPIAFDGKPDLGIAEYLSRFRDSDTGSQFNLENSQSSRAPVQIKGVRLISEGIVTDNLLSGSDVVMEFYYINNEHILYAKFLFTVFNDQGTAIFHVNNDLVGHRIELSPEAGVVKCLLPKLSLNQGNYRLALAIQGEFGVPQFDLVSYAKVFSVIGSNFYNTGRSPNPTYSLVMVEHSWDTPTVRDKRERLCDASLA